MRILIAWADDSSTNLGVRALAQGSCDVLRRVWPHAEFEFMNYGARPPSVPWSPGGLLKERLSGRMGMMEWLSSFDIYWDTRSGDSFSDIYGMPRLRTMSIIHEFAVQAGTRAGMAPQTIGPFVGAEARILARRTLSRSRVVLARDEASARAAERLGRPVDRVSTDVVFGLRQPERERPRDVVLNVSGLLWQENSHVDYLAYRRIIRDLIDRLLGQGRSVALLPHVLDSSNADNDVPTARELHEDYDGRVELCVPRDLDSARSVIASSQIVIGARMHACLNALSTGTPAVAMAYSRKFAPLLQGLGWSHVVPLTGDDVATDVLRSMDVGDLAERARDVQHRGQERVALALPVIAELTP